jgi:thioester reductase-like protein
LEQLEVEIVDAVEIDHEDLQEAENQEEEEMAMEIDAELQVELSHIEQELIAEARAILAQRAAANAEGMQEAEIDDDEEEELQEAETDDEEQPQAEIHDDDVSSGEAILAVKMDPETATRLKAEVKEYFSDKNEGHGHRGPSQDPEDDAGEGAI